jgi:hypothetical protein
MDHIFDKNILAFNQAKNNNKFSSFNNLVQSGCFVISFFPVCGSGSIWLEPENPG